MDTIDLAATATRALKLLSGQGMSEKSLYGYTHTGFGCVVRHFQAKGLIDRKPENGGNGIGCQEDIAYTLTATDHHAVFSRQRVDVFTENDVASTESARQHKDATDLVYQETNTEDTPRLIRRLTPLECERLQGFPDGWTNIPGASDSARYKAQGNSVAIPCVKFVMRRIAEAIALQCA